MDRSAEKAEYYQANKDSILKARKKYQAANQDKIRERSAAHYQANKEEQKKKAAKRRNTLEGRITAILGNAKARAKREGWQYNLDREFLMNMWIDQDGLCAITGLPLALKTTGKRWSSDLVSLDRIDADKHYTKDNVWLVSQRVNYSKGVQTYEEFIDMCKLAVERAK